MSGKEWPNTEAQSRALQDERARGLEAEVARLRERCGELETVHADCLGIAEDTLSGWRASEPGSPAEAAVRKLRLDYERLKGLLTRALPLIGAEPETHDSLDALRAVVLDIKKAL